ncbi:hypothetical protein [Pantoea agglomerans]|uniref:hypothetical protein n=1 Tax=Enterobacter agglomerans TaxID=549 RepID=UPI000E20DE5D|nr:hypothetical protein [Pantoea agglomerans]MCH9405005.1 hypothetical protein [Pantoea agglomerans]WNK29296.1 hypothetical protein RM157_12045 [Pantoea agglomerans]WNK61170.1 hypothetical protein RM152_11815 [Pantoea agglomerans]
MRLTIDGVINEFASVAVTIDGYVPVDINIINDKLLPPLYWRVGNGKKSLLELAVLPDNGFISSITLVMIEPESIHKVDSQSIFLSDSEHGLPVVNTAMWKNKESDDFNQRFIDDFSLDIQVDISSDSMLVVIGENNKVAGWIRCSDNFYLGVDDERNMVNLFLNKLTHKEIERFFEAVV